MFLINKNILYKLTLYSFLLLFMYAGVFLSYSFYTQYKLSLINVQKVKQLSLKKAEKSNIIQKNIALRNKIKKTKDSFLTQDELNKKITSIYKRMSVMNYEVSLLKSKKICLDRYILVNHVETKTKEGQKAALDLLSFLGPTKQSSKNNSIYFLDLVLDKKSKQ